MTRSKKVTLYKEERLWFFAAISILILMLSLYVYFVSASVVHVVMRKEIGQEIASVSSYVSQLESQYIDAQHAVSDEIASQKGYLPAEEKIFIDRTKTTLVLSANNDS